MTTLTHKNNTLIDSSINIPTTIRSLSERFLHNAGISNNSQYNNEFKTNLRFDPGQLSTQLLKKYLSAILTDTDEENLLKGEPPAQYTNDPDNLTNYTVLKELSLMSIREWKILLNKSNGDVSILYNGDDDMVSRDSRCFYEKWKTIQEEVQNHDKIMSFFRLVSEIVYDLANRDFVDLYDTQKHSCTNMQSSTDTDSTNKVSNDNQTTKKQLFNEEVDVFKSSYGQNNIESTTRFQKSHPQSNVINRIIEPLNTYSASDLDTGNDIQMAKIDAVTSGCNEQNDDDQPGWLIGMMDDEIMNDG